MKDCTHCKNLFVEERYNIHFSSWSKEGDELIFNDPPEKIISRKTSYFCTAIKDEMVPIELTKVHEVCFCFSYRPNDSSVERRPSLRKIRE